MFAKALDNASGFIRPVHAIIRYYNESTAKPSAYNIFFVNEHGVAVTARHAAKVLEQLAEAPEKYRSFLKEKELLKGAGNRGAVRKLEEKCGYRGSDTFPVIQAKMRFFNCFSEPSPRFRILHHPTHDLSVLVFENFGKCLRDKYKCIQPGVPVQFQDPCQ